MNPRSLFAFLLICAAALFNVSDAATAPSGAAASPMTIAAVAPRSLLGGAQHAWPVKIDQDRVFAAIFQGGMWLPDPAGGREYVRYVRHIIHDSGDLTWIGKVATAHGDQTVVLTLGKDAVYGYVPRSTGYPDRIDTVRGQSWLVRTDSAALARSPQHLALFARPDDRVPPPRAHAGANVRTQPDTAQARTYSQPPQPIPTVDVMVAYTNGFVSAQGSVSAALTRINYLVDLTNQAYQSSQVNAQIRLVHTVEVNYTDDNNDSTALDQLTGLDSNGNPVTIPAALQPIAGLRTQYGADLVALVRQFNNATNNGCGIGWLVGGGGQQIVPSQDYVYGYSVVGDGSDSGYFCLDSTFAHELGHNMGNAHDRAHADGSGAYSYSYGYLGNGTDGFATIMAYGSDTQTPEDVFSNPNISICQNTPCGVPDNSSSSADNAHSMNNTVSLIAQFEPTMVANARYVHNDVNGDGKSDILFHNPGTSGLVYWVMNGASFVSYRGFTVPAGYTPVGTGDFDGNGMADILWNGNGTLYVWLDDGNGGYVNHAVTSYPGGWTLVGCADVDGDGNQDILWYHPTLHQFVYWLMNGATLLSQHGSSVPAGFTPIGVGDFNGDGLADVAWMDASNAVYVWLGNGSTFTQSTVNARGGGGWIPSGVGDVNGDGDSDIFWYQPSSGNVQYWLMSGSTVIGYKIFATGGGYTFAGVGDFDGDGKADILWARNNVLYMWLHSDPYNYYGVQVQPYAAGWNVLP